MSISKLEVLLALKANSSFDKLEETTKVLNPICYTLLQHILKSEFIDVFNYFDSTSLSYKNLTLLIQQDSDPFNECRELIFQYLQQSTNDLTIEENILITFFYGVAFLELYCQVNYTGPELANTMYNKLNIIPSEKTKQVLFQLECDGTYPYSSIECPQLLLLARYILSVLSNPLRGPWQQGIKLDEDGVILPPMIEDSREIITTIQSSLQQFISLQWWNGRSCVLHTRLLLKSCYEEIPTLWNDFQTQFTSAVNHICPILPIHDILTINPLELLPQEKLDHSFCNQQEAMKLETLLWLECGLGLHHFMFGDKGKKFFQKAQISSKMELELSAAMGKRTKYQRENVAQLYLHVKSHFIEHEVIEPQEIKTEEAVIEFQPLFRDDDSSDDENTPENKEENAGEQGKHDNEQGWQHSEWEMGRRLVREIQGGEEAAVREVLLDDCDGGAAENIIIEGGPLFENPEEADYGGDLHPIDQLVLLALCLDVNNSNAADGLTNEQMTPYIERVLQQAKNWMIHSTGLLERSWIEFERRKTMDRAMLQIQALIDQHTTKLTIMQSSFKSVNDSAPAHDRLSFIYSLVYPSQFELKKDLAMRYLRCQVFMSALNYFKELEMWDEVVTCYQLMEKPQRAEIVVREQLKKGETPYMVTSLADLTGNEALYEKAWEISKKRFPRPKRTLGKICYDRGDFAQACDHLDAALAVQPLVHTAWYLKGICCMRIDRWEEGLEAFVRCVQQDAEVGEAWANMGAIQMHLCNWQKAHHALTEALKQKRDEWRILENLLTVTINLKKFRETILHLNTLVDLRFKSANPLHIPELRYLTSIISMTSNKDLSATELSTEQRSEAKDMVDPLPALAQQLEKLLFKITETIKSNPEVWDVVAVFNDAFGRYKEAYESRMKQFRAVINESGWEKNQEKANLLPEISEKLYKSLFYKESKKEDVYATKLLLQSTIRKLDTNYNWSNALEQTLQEYVHKVEALST